MEKRGDNFPALSQPNSPAMSVSAADRGIPTMLVHNLQTPPRTDLTPPDQQTAGQTDTASDSERSASGALTVAGEADAGWANADPAPSYVTDVHFIYDNGRVLPVYYRRSTGYAKSALPPTVYAPDNGVAMTSRLGQGAVVGEYPPWGLQYSSAASPRLTGAAAANLLMHTAPTPAVRGAGNENSLMQALGVSGTAISNEPRLS